MIRTIPIPADLGRRRNLGAVPVGMSLQFNPITAGVSAGVGLASSAIQGWMASIQQSHNAMSATTAIVNGLEQQLRNLDAAYFAEKAPTCADQRAALDAYDNAWLWLQSPQACGAPGFGSAGDACIRDRAPGGKFPWASYYREPIANDPRMLNAGCDTSQTVILPGVNTGYQQTGITAGGNLDTATTGTGGSSTPPPPTNSISPAMIALAVAAIAGVLLLK